MELYPLDELFTAGGDGCRHDRAEPKETASGTVAEERRRPGAEPRLSIVGTL